MARIHGANIALFLILMVLFFGLSKGHDPDTVEVHIICHSHTDAGWYNTYDAYFNSKVKSILSHTVEALSKHKHLKFNWADTSFLAKWWREVASSSEKKKLKELVKNGQWQFMGGGWVMHDESLSLYKNAMIQVQTGIEFLEETFGVRPKIGFQVDPFGNSPVTPSLLSTLGYEGIVLSRIGTTLDWDLENSENEEFIWEAAELDDRKDGQPILAHHLVRSEYQAPVEFKFQRPGFPFWVHPRVMCSNKSELKKNYKQ